MAQIHPDTPADDPMMVRYGIQRATEQNLGRMQPGPAGTGQTERANVHRRSPSASSYKSNVSAATIPEDGAGEGNASGFGDTLKPPAA
jgi:hypothetical protein